MEPLRFDLVGAVKHDPRISDITDWRNPMTKMRFKAFEDVNPQTMPGYGRDTNAVKDFAERNNIAIDEG